VVVKPQEQKEKKKVVESRHQNIMKKFIYQKPKPKKYAPITFSRMLMLSRKLTGKQGFLPMQLIVDFLSTPVGPGIEVFRFACVSKKVTNTIQ